MMMKDEWLKRHRDVASNIDGMRMRSVLLLGVAVPTDCLARNKKKYLR